MADSTPAIAQIPGLDEKDLVTIKLAHPLRPTDRQRLGLPEDSATGVNDEVRVRNSDALALINAGMAQVDPEDVQAVAEALGEPRNEPAAPSTPSGSTTPATPATSVGTSTGTGSSSDTGK